MHPGVPVLPGTSGDALEQHPHPHVQRLARAGWHWHPILHAVLTPSPWDVRSPWLEAPLAPTSNNPSSASSQHSFTCASPPRRHLQKPLCVGSGTSAGSADPNNPGRSRSRSVAHSWTRQRCCSERASPKEGELATHQHFNEGSDIHLAQSRE